MCLNYTTETPTHQGERTVWKILFSVFAGSGQLESLYYRNCIWKPGVNQSNRTSTLLTESERFNKEIDIGFHVYTDKDEGSKYIHHNQLALVAVTVNSCDFVAEDTMSREAVYTKVTLSKEEYAKAMKRE